MKFRYEGFVSSGVVKRGFIEKVTLEEAAQSLREMGIHVQILEPDGPNAMKTVLPGGESLDSKLISKDTVKSTTIEYKYETESQKAEIEEELKRRFSAIVGIRIRADKASAHCDLTEEGKKAIYEAEAEMIKEIVKEYMRKVSS